MMDEQITLKKLEIFAVFMHVENIGKAAEILKMSSVSVHRALHSLEEGIGCPLFVHKGRNLLPLQTARVLYQNSRHVLGDLEKAVAETRRLGGVGSDLMRLGTLYSLTVRTVPQLILGTKFRRENIEYELCMGSNENLMCKLSENQLDVIIIDAQKTPINRSRFEVLPLFVDELYLVVPSSYRIDSDGRSEMDLKDFKDEKFITLSEGFATSADFDRAFELANFQPRIVTKVKDIFSLLSLVQAGLGMALLPHRMSRVYESTVKFLRLTEKYRQYQHISIIFDRSREHEPNLLALVAEVRMYSRRRDLIVPKHFDIPTSL